MDAATMARAIKPPVVWLPRLTWVPLIGGWLGRSLPGRKYTGRVLGYLEFLPFQSEMAKAQAVDCAGCGKTLRPAPKSPEGVDGPEWFGCVCEDAPDPVPHFTEEAWVKVCEGFIMAQGFPLGPMFALPGSVLVEVMEELFLCQTRANLPRKVTEKMDQTSGNDSLPKDSGKPGELKRSEPGKLTQS